MPKITLHLTHVHTYHCYGCGFNRNHHLSICYTLIIISYSVEMNKPVLRNTGLQKDYNYYFISSN
ncbi:hypothetical protein SMUL_1800 [Sulfurospirillum multivorans DSM 12446]|uniref:Uncharacterized protein n=1 Tax=Sulfurospirillum multivorans (strain DM 12446 / JCM 15788 / NBRC 109480) TaxID=1150621 RepID=A0AA86ALK2_SULMK|nr:hypothetical protein SMUL_1800 [Sulfurospirillum multivorans DSM 12446]